MQINIENNYNYRGREHKQARETEVRKEMLLLTNQKRLKYEWHICLW